MSTLKDDVYNGISAVILILAGFSGPFLSHWPLLQKVGLTFVGPLPVLWQLAIVTHDYQNFIAGLFGLMLFYLVGSLDVGGNWLLQVFAILVVTIESCAVLHLSPLWALALLASILSISVVERINCDKGRSKSWDYVGVNLALSHSERTSVCVAWSVLLHRLIQSLYCIYGNSVKNGALIAVYGVYSAEQHLQVVEIFSVGVSCVMLVTEVVVYGVAAVMSRTSCDRYDRGDSSSTKATSVHTNTLYLRYFVFTLITTLYTTYILHPLLKHINIPFFPSWLLHLLLRDGFYELVVCINWVLLISVTVVVGFYAASKWRWPRTCSRKLFHFLVVAMFAPCLTVCHRLVYRSLMDGTSGVGLYESYPYRVFAFLVLALGVAVNVFILFEYVRLRLMPTIASSGVSTSTTTAIEQYMQLFVSTSTANTDSNSSVDSRGGLEISHVSLLLGCATPVWLFVVLYTTVATSHSVYASTTLNNTVPFHTLLFSTVPYMGLLTLGIGDACAAVVGKLFGKHKWYSSRYSDLGVGNNRTIEGSLACFVSMLVFCVYILYVQFIAPYGKPYTMPPVHVWDVFILLVVVCAMITAVEAVTQENDNVVLPVLACVLIVSFILVCLL